MSLFLPHRGSLALLLASLMIGSDIQAQTPSLLGALRVHDPSAVALARAELEACHNSHCGQQGQLSLLVGTLELGEQDPATALQNLQGAQVPPLLVPYATFYEAQARFALRDFAGAARAFEQAAADSPQQGPSPVQLRAQARQAEALLMAGKAAEALPVLEAALAQAPSPELLLARGRAKLLTQDPVGAEQDLRAVYLRFPLSPSARDALAELSKVPAPGAFTLDERLGRARVFLDAGEPTEALSELTLVDTEKLGRDAGSRAHVALLREGALYALGKSEEAEAQIKRVRGGSKGMMADALLLRARQKMQGPGPHPDAQRSMADLERRFPKETASDEAGYFAGWLFLPEEKYVEAARAFAGFVARHPRSKRREEAIWYQAYALLRAGRFEEVQQALSHLMQKFPRSLFIPQARYWSVRSQQLGGSPDVADAYAALVKDFPASFYGLLAAEQLRELGRPVPVGFPERPRLRPPTPQPELALAVALEQAGLLRDAAEEIGRRMAIVHGTDAALTLGHALALLSEHGAAYSLASRSLWGSAFTQRAPEALALFYPKAFALPVEAEARGRAVNPFMVWAIMRRESAFRPDLVSARNARGLMQLIPPTAVAISKTLEEPAPTPDALFSPALNVHLATWYIAQLFKRFEHPALVAAAYNAGPSAAARWAQMNGKLPLDLFVEAIPFKETRGYVKQVVADLFNYNAFYGTVDGKTRISLRIPAPAPHGVDF